MVGLPIKCMACGTDNYHYGRCGCRPAPTDWVLVPKVPTPEMIEASWQATAGRTPEQYMAAQLASTREAHAAKVKQRWTAMLAAAPKP